MFRVFFVVVLAAVLSSPADAQETIKTTTRPNIVLIMADDLGYECVGANGGLDYQTPVLDKIASTGLRFTHCYSQPLCTPSRVKIMTGQSNRRNYVGFGKLDRRQTTFAHLLKRNGYRTCIAGKWQLGSEPDAALHFGFEQSLLWQHTRGRVGKGKCDSRYPNPRLERNGKSLDYNQGEFSTDLFVDFIGDFISEHRDEPFLVYFPMALVHCPFGPTPDSQDWDPTSFGSTSYKGKPQYFSEMVSYVDKAVGKIDAKLSELGLRENTVLMFTGDNGTDKPIVTQTRYGQVVGAKGKMVDAGNRVPLLLQWPAMQTSGRVSNNLVDFSDFLPTLCDLAGVNVPSRLPIDGVSFYPNLVGKDNTGRSSIYVWYSRSGDEDKARVFARNQQYKLYESGEMFDVQNDRNELKPLDVSGLGDQQRAVHTMLRAKIKSFAAVVPPRSHSSQGKPSQSDRLPQQ